MICLRFSIDGAFYGFEIDKIIEIVPKIPLRPLAGTPDYIPGCFKYRGRLVPVVDVSKLTGGQSAKNAFSSRIAVVHYKEKEMLGLLLEEATEINSIDTKNDGAIQSSGVSSSGKHLEKIAANTKELIQFINTEKLLTDEVRKIIWANIEEDTLHD